MNIVISLELLIGIFLIHCGIGIAFPSYYAYVEKLNQRVQVNGLGGDKKMMVVNSIKGKMWQLPYPFENNKLDYKFIGEFAKFIRKIHIKPKDYYIKHNGVVKRQTKEWEAFFYFSKNPTKGRMEIEWM